MPGKYIKIACLFVVFIILAYVEFMHPIHDRFRQAFETTVLTSKEFSEECIQHDESHEHGPHCLFSNHGGNHGVKSVSYVGRRSLPKNVESQFSNLSWYKCNVCGSYFVWPILTDSNLTWLYTHIYNPHKINMKHTADRAFWQYRLILKYIPRMSRQKDLHVLEQGCFEGHLVSKFRNISAHMTCFEMAADADVIKDHPDVTIHQKVRVGDEVDDGSVDIYMSSHVAEHVPRPREFFQAAHRKLRMGGILFTEIPHYAGNDKKMLGSPPYNLHLTAFSPWAAREFLTEMGFCELFTGYAAAETVTKPFKDNPGLEHHAAGAAVLRIVYQKCHN